MGKLLAYHGDRKLKARFLKEMRWHRDQDMIVKGTYGEENGAWRGCAVGCSLHSMSRIKDEPIKTDTHKLYEPLLGIPEWLARLEDSIFEGLPDESAPDFPIQFSAAIKVGSDLDWVKPRVIIFFLNDCRLAAFDDGKKAIDQTISLWQLIAGGKPVTHAQWSAAWSAAESAARSAEFECQSWDRGHDVAIQLFSTGNVKRFHYTEVTFLT
jgi:hypothetical protein